MREGGWIEEHTPMTEAHWSQVRAMLRSGRVSILGGSPRGGRTAALAAVKDLLQTEDGGPVWFDAKAGDVELLRGARMTMAIDYGATAPSYGTALHVDGEYWPMPSFEAAGQAATIGVAEALRRWWDRG